MFTPSPDPPSSLLWWKCSAKGYLPLCILSGSKVGLWTPDVMIFFCSKWKITDKMTESNIKIGIVIWGFGKARNHDKFRCQSQQGQHNLNLRTNHCKASQKYNTTSVGVAVCSIHSNTFTFQIASFYAMVTFFWASATRWDAGRSTRRSIGNHQMRRCWLAGSHGYQELKDMPNINLKKCEEIHFYHFV